MHMDSLCRRKMHCSCTVHRPHSTIHIFKNYFTTVFLVFSKISCIQTDLAPRLTLISQLFSFFFSIIIFTIFTINDTFYSILLLSDVIDITNFITDILQISMSVITKNNSKHLFIILFK